jgi:protein-disulfide isomerase
MSDEKIHDVSNESTIDKSQLIEKKISGSEKKEDSGYNFKITKVRLWQGVSAILAILVVFLWFNPTFGLPTGAEISIPTGNAPQELPSQQQAPVRLDSVDEDDDPFLGNKDAPITIVSFEDYQCPFCKRAFDQTLPLIKQEYIDSGKVKFVFRDFPLGFHPEAQPAAEASECANEQGKFWEYHDALFANQATLGRDLYLRLAEDFGLDVNQFTQCLDSRKYKEEVEKDFNYGSQVGVSGTPTFFINGIKLVGAQPYQAFQQIIEQELA